MSSARPQFPTKEYMKTQVDIQNFAPNYISWVIYWLFVSIDQTIWQLYLASTVEVDTKCCFLLYHDTNLLSRNWQLPGILINLISLVKSDLYSHNVKPNIFRVPNSKIRSPLKVYKNSFNSYLMWFLRLAWNLTHKQITNIISGLLAIRYKRELIIPLYLVMSTEVQDLFWFILTIMGIRVFEWDASFISYFFIRSLIMYFDYKMKTLWNF